jgi:3',5'-cyclic AMP phosphodiesterase CpdA
MFVLAHLSDPHLGPLPPAPFLSFAGKRAIGYLNWRRKRDAAHRRETLDALVGDMQAQAPDHIAVTGDLINLSLPLEFSRAREWLMSLGAWQDVSLVPGNHDAYVRRTGRLRRPTWGDFMRGDDNTGDVNAASFPYVRQRGPVAIIGVSSAIPTAPFMATGRVGDAQRERLAHMLARLGAENLFRVVLIHHPPASPPARRFKRLLDDREFRDTLARHGAELVLHGHDHVPSLTWLARDRIASDESITDTQIPVFGVPSASANPATAKAPAAYNLYRISGEAGAWRCEVVSRGFDRSEKLVEIARTMVGPSA